MKKLFITIGALIILALVWYLFIKPQDYQVNFKVKTLPGIVYETVKTWNQTLDNPKPIQFNSLNSFTQEISINDSIHVYEWNVSSIDDSLSQVKVGISDKDHSLMNKIQVPFSDTDFEKGSREALLDFNHFLNEHLGEIKVRVIGEDEITSTYCACISLTTTQAMKAGGIMDNYSFLSSMLLESEVQPSGLPFLEVTDWNLEEDSLSYNFCFPVVRSEKLPQHPDINYKRIFKKRALKAEYNGNYITSDRAWYALLHYAEKNDIELERKPLEIYFNNPNMTGDESRWKTEIFMPIKETQ